MTALRKVLATYVHSRTFQIAVARPDSFRHDINGEPVKPVSNADRLDALKKYEGFKGRDGSGKPEAASPAPLSKTEAIRISSVSFRSIALA
ncbi:hypothetical protein [Ensifer sp. ENS10]|uniref:hypothetical protein n=1 Tax=Ensifer sp. ENS10 TaxID=2769286 RepID=UPI002811AA73|nr:hypothetical protein [Ensifer sp. ENS10]